MSLHDPNFATDKHLQTALRHAPDQDLAPSQSVRDNVLAYATNVVKQAPENLLKRSFNAFVSLHLKNWNVKAWQVASMGALASVLLVMVMVREQAPQESIWAESKVGDLAQNKVESPDEIEQKNYQLKEHQSEINRSAEAPELQNVPMRTEGSMARKSPEVRQSQKKSENLKPEAKSGLPAIEVPTKQLAETSADKAEAVETLNAQVAEAPDTAVEAAAPSVPVASSAPVGASASVVPTEADAQLASSKRATASEHSMRNAVIDHDAIVEKLLTLGGDNLAKQDIAAGNYHVLKLDTEACEKLGKHESHEAETNYKVVVLALCGKDNTARAALLQTEVGSYNKVMRNWQQHHNE